MRMVVGACLLLVLVIPAWAQNGTEYTWKERGRVKKVTLVKLPERSESAASVAQSASVSTEVFIGEMKPEPKVDTFKMFLLKIQSEGKPVFRDGTGELMYLPGGVTVRLVSSANEDVFLSKGIDVSRIRVLSTRRNWYLIQTEPGFPSLELANELVDLPSVIESIPMWGRNVVPK